MKNRLLILFLLGYSFAFGQNKKLDSLWAIYNNKYQADTNRLKALNTIAWGNISNNPDTAIILAQQELNLAQVGKVKTYEGKALNIIGVAFQNKGNYPKALDYYKKTSKIREEIGDKKGIGGCYINMANVYFLESNYPIALEYYYKALKISEEIGDKKNIGICYNNIGNIYRYQTNYPKALGFYFKALKLSEEIGDKTNSGNCNNNIGNVYKEQTNYTKALGYYFRGLKIAEEIGDKKGKGSCYRNIGIIYKEQANYHKALEYQLKGLKLFKEINNNKNMVASYGSLSSLYDKLANYKQALLYSDSTLQGCKQIGDIENERSAYQILSRVYFKTGKYKEAYENHVKFKTLTDSIFNTDNSKQLGDMKTKFEVEKKEAELKIKSDAEQEKLRAVAEKEKKRQRVIIYSVMGILATVIIFSLFLFNRFRITQRQKKVIEEQKVLVDNAYETLHEKNKEVMDSINYASRIQRALITSDKYIATQLRRLMKNG